MTGVYNLLYHRARTFNKAFLFTGGPFMATIPTLETKRLILRAPTMDDVPAYTRHFVDYEVIRNLSHVVPWPYPEGGVAEHLSQRVIPAQGNNKWVWGLFLKESPHELIGVVDLWRPGRPENRGFWLGRRYWGQGLMTEAVTVVMDYAFDDLDFETLAFANGLGNVASRRVKEKTGARLVDRRPGQYVDPQLTITEVWELTKEEWNRFRGLNK